MSGMGDEELERLWNDDESWAFPILPVDENGGKVLIESGKILTDVAVSEKAKAKKKVEPAAKGKKKKSVAAAGGGGESDDHELHIWTERERRKKMRNMFASLLALIPHLHPRADKSIIVDEAVVHIKNLEQTLEILEKLKQEKLKGGGDANPTGCDVPSREAFLAEQGSTSQQPQPPVTLGGPSAALAGRAVTFRTWSSPNVVLNVCGNDAHISVVCGATKPGILSAVVFVMDKYKLDLVSAHVSSDPDAATRNCMIHARANGVLQQFPEPEASFVVEETYKQAAAELMIWINS